MFTSFIKNIKIVKYSCPLFFANEKKKVGKTIKIINSIKKEIRNVEVKFKLITPIGTKKIKKTK